MSGRVRAMAALTAVAVLAVAPWVAWSGRLGTDGGAAARLPAAATAPTATTVMAVTAVTTATTATTVTTATTAPTATTATTVSAPASRPGGPASWVEAVRIVALYGNDASAALGVLGEQPPEEAAVRLAQVAAPFRAGDRPVQGAFELIATIATSGPGNDGLHRARSSSSHVQRYLDVADAHGLLLILDIQPGRSDFLTEVRHYEPFLRRPNVHVALDPEWHVGPTGVPGDGIGDVRAADVNAVARYLAQIVAAEQLPDKLLVVHQFRSEMLPDRRRLREPAGVELMIHMDGFGAREDKLATYREVAAAPPFGNGFKLFYDEDVDLFSPAEVLRLDPVPDLITYQ